MNPDTFNIRVKELVTELATEVEYKKKQKDRFPDKSNLNDVKKCKKKLTFHEKTNRISKLFKAHILEVPCKRWSLYVCQTCPHYSGIINLLRAKRHAFSHSKFKRRKAVKVKSFKCRLCDIDFDAKKDHTTHFQENHCQRGLMKIVCTKCLKTFKKWTNLRQHIKVVHNG